MVPGTGSSSHGTGMCHLPGVNTLTHLETLQTPYFWGFRETSSFGTIITNCMSSPSAFSGKGGVREGAENSKLLMMAWFFC